VGGAAQTRAIRRVAGRLRLDLAQYRELATFAQFGTADLDRATRAQLERGQRSTEILKQLQFQPMELAKEVITLYAVNNGYMDDIPIERCQEFEQKFLVYMETAHPDVSSAILESKDIGEDTEETMKKALADFKPAFAAQ
jgi:F-type H+-transporting ATPase subunit alpha